MSSEYGMSKLVETINKLRDACAEVDDEFLYELPQMAVVGSQSAGKSSVLENIVKKWVFEIVLRFLLEMGWNIQDHTIHRSWSNVNVVIMVYHWLTSFKI